MSPPVKWTRDVILAAIRDRTVNGVADGSDMTLCTVARNMFGRWAVACEAAGVRPKRVVADSVTACSIDGCALPPRSRVSGLCEKHYMRRRRHGVFARACRICGAELDNKRATLCSDACVAEQHRRTNTDRYRWKRDTVSDDRISLRGVYVRDGGRCGVCHRSVKWGVRWNSRSAPTIDHIIPRARGGRHELLNVQLAHRGCNSSKGARLMGQQMRLLA